MEKEPALLYFSTEKNSLYEFSFCDQYFSNYDDVPDVVPDVI